MRARDDEDERRWRWHELPVAEELHGDMTATDICHALQFMQFRRGYGLLKIDHDVQRFLLRRCGGH